MKEFVKEYGKIAIIVLAIILCVGLVIDIFNPGYGWFATVPAGHEMYKKYDHLKHRRNEK